MLFRNLKNIRLTILILMVGITSWAQSGKTTTDTPAQQAAACTKIADLNCKSVCQACQNAGYILGDVGIGKGLWVDCVNPIMQGTAEPAKAQKAGMSRPSVPASTISACHASKPNFGYPQHKK